MKPNFSDHDSRIGQRVLSRCALISALLLAVSTSGLVLPGVAQTEAPRLPAATQTTGPQIEFVESSFNFGKVKQGDVVRHDFVFRNTGSATLEITGVSPGCGCTTAGDWDKRVEPGKTGVITLQFNSSGFGGGVSKSATVTSNDPRQPTVNVQIKGEVWTPFAVTPTMALFNVSSESETGESKVVRIVSQLEQPVTLTGVDGGNAAFQTELTAVKPGKEYELKITTVPPFPSSSISTPLTVKTSSAETPTISVLAQLIVHQTVVASPERITLPAGPLSGTTSTTIIIRNNGKNALVLSEPTINAPGAAVTVHETQPGKLFQLAVKFPPAFELKSGENVEVTVKSNHPKFPVIRVPVVATPSRLISPGKASK